MKAARSAFMGPGLKTLEQTVEKVKVRALELAKGMEAATEEQQRDTAFVTAAERLQLSLLWLNMEFALKDGEGDKKDEKIIDHKKLISTDNLQVMQTQDDVM